MMPKLAPHVVYRAVDEREGFLLDLETHAFFTVNATGVILVDQLKAGASFDELLDALEKRCDSPSAGLRAELNAFLASLKDSGLLDQGKQ